MPLNNIMKAMKHVVSLSGGTASAVAADRVINRYGKDDTLLFFADTNWEDEDLHRFLRDLEDYWGMSILEFKDGRNPLEVAEQASIIPNQRRAPCSLRLKVDPFTYFLKNLPKPVTIHLGLDWTESHRMDRPKAEYEKIEGVTVDFPLCWKPIGHGKYYQTVSEWGIKPPRLYEMGFPHNNCGGRCVKQGIKEWLRLKQFMPERFAEVRDWEQAQRAKGGARATYAICRDQSNRSVLPLTLVEIEEMNTDTIQGQLFEGDAFACFCSY